MISELAWFEIQSLILLLWRLIPRPYLLFEIPALPTGTGGVVELQIPSCLQRAFQRPEQTPFGISVLILGDLVT
jgi:hypothetical protein